MAHSLMIVDDSMIIRNRILRLCSDARLPALDIVGLAADGTQAVKIGRELRPSLATMDLTMPNMDGIACIGELVGILPDIRILVVSALSDRVTALRAIKQGAHGFLHKPFGDRELVDSLLELIE